eukprot:scaffold1736_cov127-Cylindrotheca_fusiformis.AAC.1
MLTRPYYQQFDTETTNGRVLDLDLSSVDVIFDELEESEKDARQNWATTLKRLIDHYLPDDIALRIPTPLLQSQEIVLQQRIVAPKLAFGKVSSRSKRAEPRKGRMYPPAITVWPGFRDEVKAFKGSPSLELNENRLPSFSHALLKAADLNVKEEIYEQNFLVSNLREFLGRSKLIGEIAEESGGIGKIDFNLIKPIVADPKGIATSNEIAVVCESKSTHNLLLPLAATDTVRKYNMAYNAVGRDQNPRTVEWVNICHPLAELVGYMANNKRRYGALTSGSRTYFVRIEKVRRRDSMQISDVFFVGEENYLRAWAYMYKSGCDQMEDFVAPASWLVASKDSQTPERVGKKRPPTGDTSGGGKEKKARRGGGGNKAAGRGGVHGGRGRGGGVQDIPHIAFGDVDIVGILGFGRNGSVFKVCWQGKTVAMKQFDVGKDGDNGFNKEVEAYRKLQEAWGVLVPKPLFLSESISGG